MRLRLSNIPFLAVVLLALGTAFLSFQSWAKQEVEKDSQASGVRSQANPALSNGYATQTEGFPIYPHATTINTESAGTSSGERISFQTSDSFDLVFSYYKSTLRAQGWELLSESQYHPSITFRATSEVNDSSGNKEVWISGETLQDGNQGIAIILQYWPNPNFIPDYPDTEDQQVSYETMKGGFLRKIITSTVQANVLDVARHYEARMPELGWTIRPRPQDDSVTSPLTLTLEFVYHLGRDNKNRPRGGRAVIELTSIDSQTTRAVILVTGFGLLVPVER